MFARNCVPRAGITRVTRTGKTRSRTPAYTLVSRFVSRSSRRRTSSVARNTFSLLDSFLRRDIPRDSPRCANPIVQRDHGGSFSWSRLRESINLAECVDETERFAHRQQVHRSWMMYDGPDRFNRRFNRLSDDDFVHATELRRDPPASGIGIGRIRIRTKVE